MYKSTFIPHQVVKVAVSLRQASFVGLKEHPSEPISLVSLNGLNGGWNKCRRRRGDLNWGSSALSPCDPVSVSSVRGARLYS